MKIKTVINTGSFLGMLLLLVSFYNSSIFPILFKINGDIFYYFLIFFVSIFVLFSSKKMYNYLIPLICASVLSIFFNDIPSEFKSHLRLSAWVLLLLAVGPLIRNQVSHKIKEKIFFLFPKMCVIASVLSFLYWAVNFEVVGRGFFTGVMRHAMLVSPIANIALMYVFVLFLEETKKSKQFLFILLFFIIGITCLLGASRAALLGSVVGLTCMLYFHSKKKFLIIMSIFLLVSPIYFIYSSFQESKIRKISYTTSAENRNIFEGLSRKGTDNTREGLWQDRLNEFIANPVFGSGFAAVDFEVIKYKVFVREGGVVEFGSGYLALVSTLGGLGIISFLYFLYGLYRTLRKNFKYKSSKVQLMVIMYLSFFGVHLFFEGYLLAVGTLLSLVLWTVLGYLFDFKYFAKQE
ncbi:O-antigen ligase family protein [Olleya sp. HaHaR_3_96]|uniref:O-antigen ligase family protein n=1 Tax=Olleya sp. HaHaR_3_96 TaxID=2745560 RepID=UPI001C4EF606|nr:O-antigen ligase family protein [Olleya sp. HaHaR_3_96]QXP60665.1 O-antigen ligase family protein [Olleya sp. HaHaR_3_96]